MDEGFIIFVMVMVIFLLGFAVGYVTGQAV